VVRNRSKNIYFVIELLLQLTGLNKNSLFCLITHNEPKNCSVNENIWHGRVNSTSTEVTSNLPSPSLKTISKIRMTSSSLYTDIEKVYLILCGSIQFWNMNQHSLELNWVHICQTVKMVVYWHILKIFHSGRKTTSVTS